MIESWRCLKIGDQVRVVLWPSEMHPDRLHQESIEFLKWVIETRSLLTITEIDDWGLPYGRLVRNFNGREQTEYWALNHDGLELVPRP